MTRKMKCFAMHGIGQVARFGGLLDCGTKRADGQSIERPSNHRTMH